MEERPTGTNTEFDDQSALLSAGAELDAVEAALARLEDGSFDRCDQCGATIGTDRLIADPLLTRCPAHVRSGSEGSVAVLAHDQVLPFGAQQVQRPSH